MWAHRIADRVVKTIPGVREAECRMISAIGNQVDDPRLVEVRVRGERDARSAGLASEIERVVRSELSGLERLTELLLREDAEPEEWPLEVP